MEIKLKICDDYSVMQFPKKRQSDEMKKRDDGPIHITEEGFRRIQERLERLKSTLPNFINETRRTAAYGDRSDNAEYKDAKSTLRRTHRQILGAQDQIKRAVIIKSGADASGEIRLGSTVVLEMVSASSPQVSGEQKTFQILGSHETNPAQGRISFNSPLGAALMNHKRGDIVIFRAGSGSKEYKIIEVR